MKPNQFVREVKKLFSTSFLVTIPHERPEVVASQKANRKFKALLKTLFPDCEIETLKGTFCYSSGYVKKDGHMVYINCEDYRWPCAGVTWDKDILIRTADPSRKTRDGYNNIVRDISKLQEEVYKLLVKDHVPAF